MNKFLFSYFSKYIFILSELVIQKCPLRSTMYKSFYMEELYMETILKGGIFKISPLHVQLVFHQWVSKIVCTAEVTLIS